MDIAEVSVWAATHDAVVAPVELSEAFDAYLCTLPWAGSGIDWRSIPHVSLPLDGASDDEAVDWARHTLAGQHSHLLVIDSAATPGVVCRFDAGIRDFELLSNRPELFMCGVDLVDGAVRPTFEHFIERRFFMTLNACV